MKTLGPKITKKKIISLLSTSLLWSILLSIILLAATNTWAKNVAGNTWNIIVLALGIIFFIVYFLYACRALFYNQHGYDDQYLYYYPTNSFSKVLSLVVKTIQGKEIYQDKIAFKDIHTCTIGWYDLMFRVHSFGYETAHPIYFKINDDLMIKTGLLANDEKIMELSNLLKSHANNFNDPYHLVLAMNDRSITSYEYIERIVHNKKINPSLYKK